MEHEDPVLYESPPPWQSNSKFVRNIIKPIGQVLLVIGIVILIGGIAVLFIEYGVLCSGFFLLFALFFIIFGTVLWVLSYISARDRMDSWGIKLPYNRQLFQRISYDVGQFLHNSIYQYSPGPNNRFFNGIVRAANNFTIFFHPDPNLILRMALVYDHNPDGVDSYDFFLNMSNIKEGNLTHAQELAKQIYNILYSHQYWLWKPDLSH